MLLKRFDFRDHIDAQLFVSFQLGFNFYSPHRLRGENIPNPDEKTLGDT